MNEYLSIAISLCLGIGLAASTGFRVFLPLFVLSIAARFGLDLSEQWAWVGSWTAIITLGIATIVEIMAYYIPWVDNLLDSIAVPLAGIAGTLMVGLALTGIDSEVVQWGLAIIAGGGTAATIKGTVAGTRAASTATTGGAGNFLVSTTETATASVLSIVSIALPVIGLILVIVIFYFIYRGFRFFRAKSS